MNPATISLIIFAGVFAVGLLAMRLRALLPEHHLTSETKDTVKLTMGLVGTMTALVLGLLVASAKGNYDAQKADVISASARLVAMDRTLSHYGPDAAPARDQIYRVTENILATVWPANPKEAQLAPNAVGNEAYDKIQSLQPTTDDQRTLKNQALNQSIQIGEQRWLLFERSGSSISKMLLGVVICWIAILFVSFGLFAPANSTVVAALMIAALCFSGAIFLILELDHPFDGLIRISSDPLKLALAHLGK